MKVKATSALSVRRYGAAPGRHTHDHFQVLWALDGRLDLEVEGRGLRLDSGQGHVLRPGERHDFEAPHGSRCLVLDTADAQWDAAPPQPRDAQSLHHLASWLAASLDDGAPLAAGLGPLLLAQSWAPAPTVAARVRRAVDWHALAAWISEHLAQPLTATDLARRVFLSESRLRERCQAELGLSPMQWVRELRLARARTLRGNGVAVAVAARLTGYASPSALTAAMQRERNTGVSRR
jgi:AraC-like DNA-binding protein